MARNTFFLLSLAVLMLAVTALLPVSNNIKTLNQISNCREKREMSNGHVNNLQILNKREQNNLEHVFERERRQVDVNDGDFTNFRQGSRRTPPTTRSTKRKTTKRKLRWYF
ncbi:hypothetical protein TcasGA2_TC034755 [Tribolium castaneum]|uniref:Transmembrane protein n=1 Tax=Tribolium castaneum TaxID=7070 RepID=A0A139WG20_TRICA|nr:hypothetical protein TcasGA2_TC034755 [Tribolium castaneum]